jgi:hypothetical protein
MNGTMRHLIYRLPGLRLSITNFVFASALLSLEAGVAYAKEVYPWSLPKSYPAAFKAYRAILPSELRNNSFTGYLEGTGSAVEIVDLNGKSYFQGQVCISVMCSDNRLGFLIAKDGSNTKSW